MTNQTMPPAVEQFVKHGQSASYHFADDSGGEWTLAYSERNKAIELFHANPDLQPLMREEAKRFLWSLDLALNLGASK